MVKMNYPFKIPGSAPGLNDNICGVHSRLSTIITVNCMGVIGACT